MTAKNAVRAREEAKKPVRVEPPKPTKPKAREPKEYEYKPVDRDDA